jgi:hypothetical protein
MDELIKSVKECEIKIQHFLKIRDQEKRKMGIWLRKERKKRNTSLREMAKEFGISINTFAKMGVRQGG